METKLKPEWAYLKFPQINFQDVIYYSAPKSQKKIEEFRLVWTELLETFENYFINRTKRLSNVAIDAVFDSVSIGTTLKKS
jgi:Fe-S cluster assembly protein SufB